MPPREDHSQIPAVESSEQPVLPPVEEPAAPVVPEAQAPAPAPAPAPVQVFQGREIVQVNLQELAVHENIDGVRAVARLLLDIMFENNNGFDFDPNN